MIVAARITPISSLAVTCGSGRLGAGSGPSTDRERIEYWRSFIGARHGPAERQLQRSTARYLRASRDRYVQRIGDVLTTQRGITRSLTATQWAEILSSVIESAELRAAVESGVSRATEIAFRWASNRVGVSMGWAPEWAGVDKQIATLIGRVEPHTRIEVRTIIEKALREGLTVNEIQAQIAKSPLFDLPRSLMNSRTEATRAVSGGSYAAFQNAASQGVTVLQQWLSAGDARPSHLALGRTEPILVGEKFKIPLGSKHAGETALYPGGFGVPGEDINCRCTVVPIVE